MYKASLLLLSNIKLDNIAQMEIILFSEAEVKTKIMSLKPKKLNRI
jgi:hypothetical protein